MCTSKVCSKCKEEKPASDFSPRSDRPIGLYSCCKRCKAASRSKRYHERKREDPVAAWVRGAANNAKDRARRTGTPYELSKKEVRKALDHCRRKCAYCGKALDFQCSLDNRWDAPSLDKVVPRLGYVPSNIVVCCYRCNAVKNDASPQELRALADAIELVAESRGLG